MYILRQAESIYGGAFNFVQIMEGQVRAMCGIVGYIGEGQAAPFLLQGLQKLEYRGYDSAGVAVFTENGLKAVKAKGRLHVLSEMLNGGDALRGTVGIGHTRWATHGAPNEENAHPQVSEGGRFAVVHNGIIENYQALREKLQHQGVQFTSETDTETAVQLLELYYDGDILKTIRKVTDELQGSYALGILCADQPQRLYAVRKDSPLIVGLGQGANFIASDIPAILSETREICRLQDGEIAVLSTERAEFFTADGKPVEKIPEHISWNAEAAEKGGFEHFMLKEIFEQPKAVRDTIQPRIRDGRVRLDFELTEEQLRDIHKICIVACGTAYHVGVAAKYAFEELLRLPVEVDVSSEFRYRAPILDAHTLVIIISQSGETADTLAALREAKRRGSRVLSIVNVVGSTIAAESDDVIYTWAGPEISVASTKAYSTQLAVIWLLALYFGEKLHVLTEAQLDDYVHELLTLPEKLEAVLTKHEKIKEIVEQLYTATDVYFIGRGVDYAVALEAALKLKEISYIHAEAYPAGELKHGPISLIEQGTPVIALAAEGRLFSKMLSNMREVKTRGARIFCIALHGQQRIETEADYVLGIPPVSPFMLPSLSVVPMQLFAYYMALYRGCDIDKPRNLAKSVTVE